jgi:UMF1 family MFS transporter
MATLSFSLLTAWTGSARVGMATMLVFLTVGFAILWKTPYPAANSAKA